MDTSEEEERTQEVEEKRMKEKWLGVTPRQSRKRGDYYTWLEKQANQMRKTLDQDAVNHSRARKEVLRHRERAYIEEAKRIKDLIADGK